MAEKVTAAIGSGSNTVKITFSLLSNIKTVEQEVIKKRSLVPYRLSELFKK